MRMSDVRVGMRLMETGMNHDVVTVTEVTDRGFKYDYDHQKSFIPRWGWSFQKTGHEYYGFNGEAWFEPVPEEKP